MKFCHVFSTCPPGKGIGFSFDLQTMFYVKFIEIHPVILETEIDNYVKILQRCRCRCVLIDRQRMKAQKVHLYFQSEPFEVSLIFGCTRIIFFVYIFFQFMFIMKILAHMIQRFDHSRCSLFSFNFSRTPRDFSIKHGIKHPWVNGIQICSTKIVKVP